MEAPDTSTPAVAAAAKSLEASLRPLPKGAWLVSGGTRFCTNADDAPWSATVVRHPDGHWIVSARPGGFPWTRRRSAAIAGHRAAQLKSLLEKPRELPTDELHPFHAGDGAAAKLRAFAARAGEAALSSVLLLLTCTAMAWVILGVTERELLARAEVFVRLGLDPVPRVGEVLRGRWGGAFLLGAPIAAFLGAVHAIVHFAGARFLFVARFAPWATAFLALVTAGALGPRVAWPWTPLFALLVPFSALLGTTLAWGRGRDEIRPPGTPRARLPKAALAAVAAILVALLLSIPLPRAMGDRLEETALFRDRFLLTNPLGKSFAELYYRGTRWTVEALAPVVRGPGAGLERQQRCALVIGEIGGEAEALLDLGFAIEPLKEGQDADPLLARRQHDLIVLASPVTAPLRKIRELGLLPRTLALEGTASKRPDDVPKLAIGSSTADWKSRLVRMYEPDLFEGLLDELAGEGMLTLFHLGPPAVLIAVLALAAALLAPAWGRSPRAGRIATFSLAAVVLVAAGLLAAPAFADAGRIREIREERRDDPATIEILKRGLLDPSPGIRHEAVYRAYRCLEVSTFPRGGLVPELLKVAKDPEVRVRLWAAPALGLTRDPRARAAILEAMNDPEVFVRYRAAQGLAHLDRSGRIVAQNPESLAALKKMIREGTWYEQHYALDALRKLRGYAP